MKRVAVFALAVMVLGALANAAVARSQGRSWEQTQSYDGPNQVGFDTDAPGVILGGVEFQPGRATSVQVEIEDETAPGTLALVRQADFIVATICTRSDGPIAIRPGVAVEITLHAGVCGNAPAFATKGLVRATFTRG